MVHWIEDNIVIGMKDNLSWHMIWGDERLHIWMIVKFINFSCKGQTSRWINHCHSRVTFTVVNCFDFLQSGSLKYLRVSIIPITQKFYPIVKSILSSRDCPTESSNNLFLTASFRHNVFCGLLWRLSLAASLASILSWDCKDAFGRDRDTALLGLL